ncbi:MAG: AzlD domain-containing protein [Treponemataceae bacterium]|nr:AzlD domain-containing protein [Treponemataceae bacterium]
MLNLSQALGYMVVMALIIFCCRAFPWIILALQELVQPRKRRRSENTSALFRKGEKKAEIECSSSGTEVLVQGEKEKSFPSWLPFIEQTVPPIVMTILACTSIMDGMWQKPPTPWATAGAALATLVLHLWKRNALLSILGGTGLFIVLGEILGKM